MEDILTHSAPVSSAPGILKGPPSLLDFILAGQSVVFNKQDQTTGNKLYLNSAWKS